MSSFKLRQRLLSYKCPKYLRNVYTHKPKYDHSHVQSSKSSNISSLARYSFHMHVVFIQKTEGQVDSEHNTRYKFITLNVEVEHDTVQYFRQSSYIRTSCQILLHDSGSFYSQSLVLAFLFKVQPQYTRSLHLGKRKTENVLIVGFNVYTFVDKIMQA